MRKSTPLPQYVIHQAPDPPKRFWTIKSKLFDSPHWFDLFQEDQLLFSVRQAASPNQYLLQDNVKNSLGRFFIVNSANILLRRSPETVLARLSMRESPPSKGFVLVLDVFPEERWLLASLLFAMIVIEKTLPDKSTQEGQKDRIDES